MSLSNASGTGSLHFDLELESSATTCVGFDECHVVTWANALFPRTIQ